MTLLLIPFVEIASAAQQRTCSRRAVWGALTSYVLIAITYRLRQDLVGPVWWARGVWLMAEGSSVALLIGFLAAYWFAADTVNSAEPESSNQARSSSTLDPANPDYAPLCTPLTQLI
jgi:hypothetical protein